MGKQPGTGVMGQGGAQGRWQGSLLLMVVPLFGLRQLPRVQGHPPSSFWACLELWAQPGEVLRPRAGLTQGRGAGGTSSANHRGDVGRTLCP